MDFCEDIPTIVFCSLTNYILVGVNCLCLDCYLDFLLLCADYKLLFLIALRFLNKPIYYF
jgi:hypothetical protein